MGGPCVDSPLAERPPPRPTLTWGSVQTETASEATFDRSWEQRAYSLRASAVEHEISFADGVIEVRRTASGLFRARAIWDHGHGERELTTEGPYAKIHAKIGQILKDGPTVGPAYDGSRGVRFVTFESDGSSRAAVPEGEVRIKPFLGQHVILFVPDGGFRALSVAQDPELLVRAGLDSGADWSSGPRAAVRFAGKHRELRVSNLAHELAFHRLDDDTILSLVPHSLPEDGRPAMVALRLVCGDEVRHLAIFPALTEDAVIWSDEQVPSGGSAAPRATMGSRTPATQFPGSGFVTEEVRELLVRYLHEHAAGDGPAQDLRQEISPLMLAIERGVEVRGWGQGLRRMLERAGDFRIDGHKRTFNHWVKALKKDGILARPLGDSRKVEFTFHEFSSLNSPAVARLYAWAKLEPPSTVIRPPSTRSPRTTPPPCPGTRTAHPNSSPTSPSIDRFGEVGCNGEPPRPPTAVPTPTAAPSPVVPPTPASTAPPTEPVSAVRAPAAPPGAFTPQTWAELAKTASDHGDDSFPEDAPEPWPDELKPEFLFYQPRGERISDKGVPKSVDDTARGPPGDRLAEDDADDAARGPPEVET